MLEKQRAVMENQHFFYELLSSTMYFEKHKHHEYDVIRSKKEYNLDIWPSFYTYNINPTKVKTTIDKILSKRIPWQIWVEDIPKNKEIIHCLGEKNFKKTIEFTGMIVDLNGLKEFVGNTSNILIEKVKDIEGLRDWATVIVENWWGGDSKRIEALIKAYKEIYLSSDIELFVAYLNQIPVGTSLALYHKDAIGLYMVYTKPAYRNLGLGRMLTQKPIVDSKNKCYKWAVLHATDEGKIIYEKLGFKEVYNVAVYYKEL